MKNYNDFPILTDELYKKMEQEFQQNNSQNKSFEKSMLSEIYSYFFAFSKSINLIAGLRTKDKKLFQEFSNSVINMFNQNYPNLNIKNIKESSNIFEVFNFLINCQNIIEKLTKNKINQNYMDFCKNLNKNILYFFNQIFSSLQTQYIKFFKFL